MVEMLQQSLRNPLAISFGAIAGALSRYYVTLWFAQNVGTSFPYSTFLINLTGCLGLGFFITLAVERISVILPELRLLVVVGFFGSYTTFSTYGLDTIILLRDRSFMAAGFYWMGSSCLGIVSFQLGVILARLGQ